LASHTKELAVLGVELPRDLLWAEKIVVAQTTAFFPRQSGPE
jgi:hypothetical protein